MRLYDRLLVRNKKFREETYKILDQYKSKFDGVIDSLIKTKVKVDWMHINYDDGMEGEDDLLSIHGMMEMSEGDTLFDPDLNQRVVITAKNKDQYLTYVKLEISAEQIETASVDEIVKTIRKIYKIEDKISGEEFQLLNILSNKAH